MSLVEQIKYLDNAGGNEVLQHEYMINNIMYIVNGLKEYVRINFPNTYNNPLNNDAAYIDLIMQGLQGTKLFDEYEKNLPNGINIGVLSAYLTTNIKCP